MNIERNLAFVNAKFENIGEQWRIDVITKIPGLGKKSESQENLQEASNVVQLKQKRNIPYMIILLVIVILVLVGGYFLMNRTYKNYKVDVQYNHEDENAMEYLSFQGGFIKYNTDGITYEDKLGNTVWTEALTMTEPKVVIRGNYVALADIGNNQYLLYNTVKKIGTFTTDYPVIDIQLATQGMVTVILEDEKVNYIMAFDQDGEKCLEIKTTINKNGYPIAVAVSEDGTKMVVSYITIEGTQVESSLTFYNFGNVGKNEVDRQVGYKKFDNELIMKVEFLGNDKICAFGDNRIVLYEMKQKPKEIMNRQISKQMKSILYNDKYVGYVYKDTSLPKAEEDDAKEDGVEQKTEDNSTHYVIQMFTTGGKVALTQDIDFNYTSIHSTEKEIVVVAKDRCKILKYNGFVKYDKTFDNGLQEFFPTNRRNRYVMITNEYTKLIKLK